MPEVAEDPRFASNAMRVLHRKDLHGLIVDFFATLPATEIHDRLALADIACPLRNSIHEVPDHPQLVGRAPWCIIPSPIGLLRAAPAGAHGMSR